MTQVPQVRADGLQVSEHPKFQERFWKIERWAWVGFVIIIGLAVSGLTGSGGPLSEAKISIGGAEVTYPRVARWQTGTRLRVTLPGRENSARIALSHAHSDRFATDNVIPQAERVVSGSGEHSYEFAPTSPGTTRVIFELTARGPGLARYDITVSGERKTLTTLILP